MSAPRVFISYSREGREHEEWVLELAQSLRRNGIDAILDQWDLKPGADLTLFMESQIRDSDFVILVCTPAYAQKSNIPYGGVGYEKNIISAEMLQSRDLRPKFIPVLRDGDFDSALPTYLGSKYGIDFRSSREQVDALNELLRAIHEAPHPSKPDLGSNPFQVAEAPEADTGSNTVVVAPVEPKPSPHRTVTVSGYLEPWEQRAQGRLDFLRGSRIKEGYEDPFASGYWQATFALHGSVREVSLRELRDILSKSTTNRTGWDIGWVPTKDSISAYPFQDGIEVWLAEEGGKGPAHSDFWRAEKFGTFSLFRGYQEDEADFVKEYPEIKFDYCLMLWRVAEFLLYLEKFAGNISVGDVGANVRFRWTGLEGRMLGCHDIRFGYGKSMDLICRQPGVESGVHIENTSIIKKTLIQNVHNLTRPLFEVFDFFSLNEEQIKVVVHRLFDADKEGI